MSFFVCIVEYNSMNLNYFKLSLLLIQLYISNIYADSNPINYFHSQYFCNRQDKTICILEVS